MIQHIFIWSITAVMFFNHGPDRQQNKPKKEIPVIMDTSAIEPGEYYAKFLSIANHNPLYIGPYKDTIIASRHWTELGAYYVYGRNREHLPKPDSSGLEVWIDTGLVIACKETSLGSAGHIRSFKAYPVMLTNTSRHEWSIGSGFHIPLILEAMDHKGHWRPVEEPYIYRCGTGMNSIKLPAGGIAIASVPIQQGAFKTRLRLRFRHILSNEFAGNIEPSQFESRSQKR